MRGPERPPALSNTPTTHPHREYLLKGGREWKGKGETECVAIEVVESDWWAFVASHPPPSLPLEGGRDELGRGIWMLGVVELTAGLGAL